MSHERQLLVVDDEKDITRYLVQLLEDEGMKALPAYSGQDALQIVKKMPIDILITDIRMPEMDGIELIRKTGELNPNIQTFVLTGHGDIDTAIEAMQQGALNYLRKPVNFDELLITIKRGFELISLRETLEKKTYDLIKTNRELKQALSEIKQLSSFLPICSSCKKIRDDDGYWNRIESYIETHTDSVFTHSICPQCSEKLYGKEKWYRNTLKKKRRHTGTEKNKETGSDNQKDPN
jgi:YesN/AraC family two-component response regulator